MSRKGDRGTVPGRTRSVFHRRGGGPIRSAPTAFGNNGMDTAQDPLQLARTAVRAFDLDLLLRVLHEQLGQPSTLLTDEFKNGQSASSLKTEAIRTEHTYLLL